jgi:hypothetical protein
MQCWGVYHSCAIMTAGTVQCFGNNGMSALGLDPSIAQSAVPVEVGTDRYGVGTARLFGASGGCGSTG